LRVAFLGTFFGPTQEDFTGLITYGGGTVIEVTESWLGSVVLIHDVRDNSIPNHVGDRDIISAQWILDSISCYRQLPTGPYLTPVM
jgi:hypothetical protein